MCLKEQIIKLLDNDQQILNLGGWEQIRNALFSILLDNDLKEHWYDVCAFIYSTLAEREYPVNFTIALLHTCLEESDELDENLVWSITKDLKKIEYLAEYDPYQDEAVFEEMKKITR